MRHLIWTLLWLAAAFPSKAAAIAEAFDSDPTLRGWKTFGDASLFQWDSTNQNLAVTWDSSRTNSLFYRPLGTVLAKSDNFSFSFDLRLRDIAIGVNPEKPYTFQIALGLCQIAGITNEPFFRGAGTRAGGPRNLVEFDYFPDSGFGATIAPTVVSTNNAIAFSDNHPLELTPNDLFHVQLSYTASNQLLRTTMTRNGTSFASLYDLSLAGFPDFRVDTFAVVSYSDVGQSPPQYSGSILAHGSIDNINWTVPEPPLIVLRGVHTPTRFRAHFYAVTNWLYRLEVTRNFQEWFLVAEWPPTTNGPFMLEDTEINPDRAFYRVIANRP